MNVGIQSRLVKGREGKGREGKESSMWNDTMKVALQLGLVKGRKGFKVKHNQGHCKKHSM